MKHELWCPLEDMKKEGLWYAIVTRDRQGKIVSRERRKSHSFLKQWNQAMFVQMEQDSGLANIKDTTGINRTGASSGLNFDMQAAIADDSQGIRVGTGNTPVAIDDFALETAIEEGVGAGQMEHQAVILDDSVVAAPTCYIVVHRTITNNSGSVITVREAGIYVELSGVVLRFCGLRDVLTVPQAVPNGGSITIDWTIGVTV